MKYTKYTVLAMSALTLGTVGAKVTHAAHTNQHAVSAANSQEANAKKATDAVHALFANKEYTKLASGVTSAKVDAAEALVHKYVLTYKDSQLLLSLCNSARHKLSNSSDDASAIKAAEKVVDALFTDRTHAKLATGVTAEKIEAAVKTIEKNVPHSNSNYQRLMSLCDRTKSFSRASNNDSNTKNDIQKATDAVNALFADGSHTKLAKGVTTEKIEAAQKLVDKIPTSNPNYVELRNLCTKAKNLLNTAIKNDVKVATKAVTALFADSSHTKLAKDVTAEKIEAAQKLVDKIPTNNENYQRLNDLCQKAKKLLAENNDPAVKEAEKAVFALFSDEAHTKLAKGVTAEKIEAAQKLVEKNVSQSNNNYQMLMTLCRKAKILLDNANTEDKIREAEEAVYALFADSSLSSVADSTNSAKVEAAKDLVAKNVSVANPNFSRLWNLCLKAERLLEASGTIRPASSEGEQEAIDAIKALFSDDTYTKLSDKANSAMLKKANALFVKYVKPGNSNFTVLYKLYQKAERLLESSNDIRPAASKEEQAVIDAVNALFTDGTHTKLAAGVDRDKINEAKSMIAKYLTFDNRNTMILYNLCAKALELLN
ncbi:toxin Cry1Ac domain D-VI-related protein [Pediococcus acidilactici]|uniref:Toxin Cry1Ac domain D-VI-related protein n=1 Tax=Pediococcus acidilactici TaxID=1254 RepID=A0AAW8YLQ4_PEDAC|nr:toxin Cry1Ac domain D-VI-related protein [Pediococcus acidilactici]MDV2910485.1 toxin Cry1Ac domain D-VI-related protein [Pediococcus acidilactici]WQS16729.1 toxin Cry1Ac domain D-VI-related protein [Pediococcus acidilactici]